MNKQQEKDVLRMVYKESDYTIIDEICEKPDFILKDCSNVIFGVEVTEYFNTESAARLLKVPNYLDKLLNEDILEKDKYIHKKDKKILKIDSITLLDENGNPKFETKAIIQDNPSRAKYLENLEAVIMLKDEKCKEYNTSLNYNSLVIYDRCGGLDLIELEYFYEAFYSLSIISTLQNSLFKEISLIIAHKEDKYYINLKEFLFLSKLFLFIYFYEDTVRKENKDLPILQFIIDLLYCLDKNGFKDVGLNFENERIEIFYACTGFEIFKNKVLDISVNKYNYLKVPQHLNILDFLQYFRTVPDEAFFQLYKNYEKEKVFKCNCAILCHN